MKIQCHSLLLTTLIGSFGGSNALWNPFRRTQVAVSDEKSSTPHDGCLLLLNDLEPPRQMLVGKSYDEMAVNSDYHIANEAGQTAAACNNGNAGGYTCNNVDLLSMIDLSNIKPGGSSMANDIWGWTHSGSGREFAIICLKEGTSFVEITDEYNPVVIGFLPTKTSSSSWRDVKTMGNYALIVSEASDHGMQVFDLTRLLSGSFDSDIIEDAHYGEFGNAHNIFANEDTGYAYAVGTNTCDGGLHVIGMDDPLNPVSEGCYSEDGYSHDVQCVVYNGPDASYKGSEICFGSNEDTITIVDVTDKNNMVQLAKKSYSGDRYTHQGWLTEDHSRFIFNDELDEYQGVVSKTRTHVFDVTNLNDPVYSGFHDGRTAAIDHNLYVHGDLVYQANYRAGLNILKIVDIDNVKFEEAGYFDIYPTSDSMKFNGAWSNYPYFPSGIVVVSGIESGLFVLKYNGANSPTPQPVANPEPTQPPNSSPTSCIECSDIEHPRVDDCTTTNLLDTACNKNRQWTRQEYCQLSCFNAGNGYDGDNCCQGPVVTPTKAPVAPPTKAPTEAPTLAPTSACTQCTNNEAGFMIEKGFNCETYNRLGSKCNKKNNWIDNKYCQQSCFLANLGYAGDTCCTR